jgi:hypothetical protein
MMDLLLERQLPEEILDHMVSFVPRRALHSLCLASKTFNRIATPHLYSSITVGHRHGYRNGNRVTASSSLARLLFSSTSHAALVHSVTTRSKWGRDAKYARQIDKYSWPNPGTPKLESILREKCTKFSPNNEEADEIYAMLESGTNEDAMLALLLFSLPNMRRLDINFGLDDHTDFHKLVPLLSRRSKLLANQLSIPLDVSVKGNGDKYPNDPNEFATMLHMPRLRVIYGWQFGDSDGDPDLVDGPFGRLRPRSHHVKTIELRTSKLHKDNFQLLMDATVPGELTTFNYEIGCTWGWCNVEHPAIMRSLSVHHDTLESLGLSHEDFYPYQFGNEDENPWPCSFVPFKALKRLKIAPVYIWGHDGFNDQRELKKAATKDMLWKALPENLEQLWITRAQMQEPMTEEETAVCFEPDCLLPALHLVVRHKSKAFPKLSQLRLEFPRSTWKREWCESLTILCETASSSGIQCTIIIEGLEDRKFKVRGWGWDEEVEWEECHTSSVERKTWLVTAKEGDLVQAMSGSDENVVD